MSKKTIDFEKRADQTNDIDLMRNTIASSLAGAFGGSALNYLFGTNPGLYSLLTSGIMGGLAGGGGYYTYEKIKDLLPDIFGSSKPISQKILEEAIARDPNIWPSIRGLYTRGYLREPITQEDELQNIQTLQDIANYGGLLGTVSWWNPLSWLAVPITSAYRNIANVTSARSLPEIAASVLPLEYIPFIGGSAQGYLGLPALIGLSAGLGYLTSNAIKRILGWQALKDPDVYNLLYSQRVAENPLRNLHMLLSSQELEQGLSQEYITQKPSDFTKLLSRSQFVKDLQLTPTLIDKLLLGLGNIRRNQQILVPEEQEDSLASRLLSFIRRQPETPEAGSVDTKFLPYGNIEEIIKHYGKPITGQITPRIPEEIPNQEQLKHTARDIVTTATKYYLVKSIYADKPYQQTTTPQTTSKTKLIVKLNAGAKEWDLLRDTISSVLTYDSTPGITPETSAAATLKDFIEFNYSFPLDPTNKNNILNRLYDLSTSIQNRRLRVNVSTKQDVYELMDTLKRAWERYIYTLENYPVLNVPLLVSHYEPEVLIWLVSPVSGKALKESRETINNEQVIFKQAINSFIPDITGLTGQRTERNEVYNLLLMPYVGSMMARGLGGKDAVKSMYLSSLSGLNTSVLAKDSLTTRLLWLSALDLAYNNFLDIFTNLTGFARGLNLDLSQPERNVNLEGYNQLLQLKNNLIKLINIIRRNPYVAALDLDTIIKSSVYSSIKHRIYDDLPVLNLHFGPSLQAFWNILFLDNNVLNNATRYTTDPDKIQDYFNKSSGVLSFGKYVDQQIKVNYAELLNLNNLTRYKGPFFWGVIQQLATLDPTSLKSNLNNINYELLINPSWTIRRSALLHVIPGLLYIDSNKLPELLSSDNYLGELLSMSNAYFRPSQNLNLTASLISAYMSAPASILTAQNMLPLLYSYGFIPIPNQDSLIFRAVAPNPLSTVNEGRLSGAAAIGKVLENAATKYAKTTAILNLAYKKGLAEEIVVNNSSDIVDLYGENLRLGKKFPNFGYDFINGLLLLNKLLDPNSFKPSFEETSKRFVFSMGLASNLPKQKNDILNNVNEFMSVFHDNQARAAWFDLLKSIEPSFRVSNMLLSLRRDVESKADRAAGFLYEGLKKALTDTNLYENAVPGSDQDALVELAINNIQRYIRQLLNSDEGEQLKRRFGEIIELPTLENLRTITDYSRKKVKQLFGIQEDSVADKLYESIVDYIQPSLRELAYRDLVELVVFKVLTRIKPELATGGEVYNIIANKSNEALPEWRNPVETVQNYTTIALGSLMYPLLIGEAGANMRKLLVDNNYLLKIIAGRFWEPEIGLLHVLSDQLLNQVYLNPTLSSSNYQRYFPKIIRSGTEGADNIAFDMHETTIKLGPGGQEVNQTQLYEAKKSEIKSIYQLRDNLIDRILRPDRAHYLVDPNSSIFQIDEDLNNKIYRSFNDLMMKLRRLQDLIIRPSGQTEQNYANALANNIKSSLINFVNAAVENPVFLSQLLNPEIQENLSYIATSLENAKIPTERTNFVPDKYIQLARSIRLLTGILNYLTDVITKESVNINDIITTWFSSLPASSQQALQRALGNESLQTQLRDLMRRSIYVYNIDTVELKRIIRHIYQPPYSENKLITEEQANKLARALSILTPEVASFQTKYLTTIGKAGSIGLIVAWGLAMLLHWFFYGSGIDAASRIAHQFRTGLIPIPEKQK